MQTLIVMISQQTKGISSHVVVIIRSKPQILKEIIGQRVAQIAAIQLQAEELTAC